MKPTKIIIVAIALIGSLHLYSQTLNWNSLDSTKHIVNVGIGWDYSLYYSLGYAYKVDTNTPFILHANFSIPSGETLLDDFKTKIGVQVILLNKPNLKGALSLNGIYRRYENPLVRLQNFGSEFKGSFGYYKPRWFVAGEVGFDKAIVTHFKHSQSYREIIYQDVKDGWYEPTTGGHFLYGIQSGYSFKKSDITLNIGFVTTQDFKTTPLIPYYLMFGYNYKI
ncbi:hypothetical protein [Confluentibacter citreus]|uniref:hypothetical protein n=1 Tax=Confluentibacter citreus TaxID=2007307 RepID=UPI000C2895D0|nr:hypothetical protein [Confluentibacter citreus]